MRANQAHGARQIGGWITTFPPNIGLESNATQSTPPSREALVWRVSSPIAPNSWVMRPSNSEGDRSIRLGRSSNPESTSVVPTKRGSNISSSTRGLTGTSSSGALDTEAFKPRRHSSGRTCSRTSFAKVSEVTLTESKQALICCPVAGSIASIIPFNVRQLTGSEGLLRKTVSIDLRAI